MQAKARDRLKLVMFSVFTVLNDVCSRIQLQCVLVSAVHSLMIFISIIIKNTARPHVGEATKGLRNRKCNYHSLMLGNYIIWDAVEVRELA